MRPRFDVGAEISAAGLGAVENDDCAGYAETPHGLYAWVIDGGTSVADRNYLGQAQGDVAWFSRALSAALARRVDEGLAPKPLHAAAAAEVAALYAAACARAETPPPYAQPIAAVTIVRVAGDVADLYQLADCAAFSLGGGGVRRLTVGGAVEEEDGTDERVAASQASVGYAPEAVWADQLESLRARREEQVGVSPRSISTPAADDAFGGWERACEVTDIDALVLMSDGFERYTAKYRLGDAAEMVRRAVTEGPRRVLEAVRATEAQDPDCRCFPRLKASDDATCLVLRRGARD